jgi:hypothetical protein
MTTVRPDNPDIKPFIWLCALIAIIALISFGAVRAVGQTLKNLPRFGGIALTKPSLPDSVLTINDGILRVTPAKIFYIDSATIKPSPPSRKPKANETIVDTSCKIRLYGVIMQVADTCDGIGMRFNIGHGNGAPMISMYGYAVEGTIPVQYLKLDKTPISKCLMIWEARRITP